MIRGMCLSAAALMMLAAPAFAAEPDAVCKEPVAPTMPDGRTAPAKDIIAAATAVKAFVAASDEYQACEKMVIDTMETAAKADKKEMDPKVKAALEMKGDANQAKKEELGQRYAITAAAYRQAHPK